MERPLIALVCMPWQSLDTPSLAIGILATLIDPRQFSVQQWHANLDWGAYIARECGVAPDNYNEVGNESFFVGTGEWIFTSALYGRPWMVDEYCAFLMKYDRSSEPARLLHMHAAGWIGQLAHNIVSTKPSIVALTTTFLQNVPSLALARVIKVQRPNTVVVIGGGNCEGVQGQALHRSFPFLDYVARGEGEFAWPALLEVVFGDRDPSTVPGLCWRATDGSSHANSESHHLVPGNRIPSPSYSVYFDQLENSPIRGELDPKVVLESARGCWWGEVQHCTFCGLNGSAMTFRSKSPERFHDELKSATESYQCLDIMVVDNIMDMKYFNTLLPALAADQCDWRIHYEVKANLKAQHIRTLAAAGVVHIQPGIESLSTSVLKLMRKGVTAAQNVQLLRQCEEESVTVSWNLLYGFPGETVQDYEAMMSQLPNLVHLQPPEGVARIVLERFSPYFDDPGLGFYERCPAECYRFIYDLPADAVEDLVYIFDCPPAGLTEARAGELRHGITEWRRLYFDSSLVARSDGSAIVIEDRRANREPMDYRLADPLQQAVVRALSEPHSIPGVLRRIASDAVGDCTNLHAAASDIVKWLEARDLVFRDRDTYISLATSIVPEKVAV